MKLTIRTDIIATLKSFLKQEYTGKYRFLFGKTKRTGFLPYLNRFDYQCVKDALSGKYSTTKTRVGRRQYKKLCDIGFVTDRRVLLASVEEHAGDEITVTVFHIKTCDIILLCSQHEYQIEIELTHKPFNMKQLFEPVKFLYGLFQSPVEELDDTKEVIESYNSMFEQKQDTPWMVPQGLKFLSENLLGVLSDYVLMPMRRGAKYMLYLSEKGAFLVSKRSTLRVGRSVPTSLHGTIVMGEWYEKSFVGYDIAIFSGKDIRSKSFLQRLKSLRVVSIRFPFCEMVRCYRQHLAENMEKLLEEYEGVIFTPVRANYMNDRVFLYQEVENVGIKFTLQERSKCGFNTFVILSGVNNDPFVGTDSLPFRPDIPLSQDDREFIGPLNNTIFEFRWQSDGFMPYMRSYQNETSTSKFARQAWEYINEPLEKSIVLDTLRTFKKESVYAKEKLAMAKQFGKLKMLPVNKTVVFWSPIEGDDVLIRTGTIAEGSCFFHSLLYAYSKEYVSMDKRERMKFVRRLRASMSGKVDRENWEGMGGGLIAKIPFQEKVNYILVNFYRFLDNDSRARGRDTKNVIKKLVGNNANELEMYRLVAELIPKQEGFEQTILPRAYRKSEDGKIADCCDAIIEESIAYLDAKEEIKRIPEEKAEYIRCIVRKLLTEVLKESEEVAYNDYVKGLKNVAKEVDTYTIGLISDRFKRDIYFLDGKNRMPYNNSSTTENLTGRKSIIVLWIGGNHYEIVGRLLPGNRIQREFSHDDPLIQKMYNLLVKPEEVHEKYPELVPYLPREYQNSSPSPHRFTDTDESEDEDRNMSVYDSSDPEDDDSYCNSSSDQDDE